MSFPRRFFGSLDFGDRPPQGEIKDNHARHSFVRFTFFRSLLVAKFPVDAPIRDVVRAFERLGFVLVREGNHISMARENPDGTRTTLTMPNHRTLKASTLRTILSQASISRDDFQHEFIK